MKLEFIESFTDDDLEERINASLKTLKQGANKSVKCYLSRFCELIARSDEATEDSWYHSWVGGLRADLREAVRFIGYRGLDSAAWTALRKENTAHDARLLENSK